MTEEERAALWQQQHANRVAAAQARAALLAGNPVARQALQEAWQPMIDARAEPKPSEAMPLEVIEPPPVWLAQLPPNVELPEHLKRYRR